MSANKLLQAASGGAGESVYVEDVFSTQLYEGTGSAKTITTDIDMSGEGGMVWFKSRSSATWNFINDTERGATKSISTNSANAENTYSQHVTQFNSNGYNIGTDNDINLSGGDFVNWSFRKQAGFFDVVTYTGTGVARTVSHNLGSTPAVIIVKGLNIAENWIVYHTSLGATKYIQLNTNGAAGTYSAAWNDTAPTSTEFTVGTFNAVNESGYSYVAYLFAHDDQSFGDNSNESIIKCGSYTGTGSSQEINLGFEPQWILIKNASSASGWILLDTMRGWANSSSSDNYLFADSSSAEAATDLLDITATGFIANSASFYGSGETYIYIAIRRPMKTAESASDVFDKTTTSQDSTAVQTNLDVVDLNLQKQTDGTTYWFVQNRLTGNVKYLRTNDTTIESDYSSADPRGVFDTQGKVRAYTSNSNVIFSFKRARKFLDIVAYEGNDTLGRTLTHNLDAVPELAIFRRRDGYENWVAANTNTSQAFYLNSSGAANSGLWTSRFGSSSAFTSSSITLGNTSNAYINELGDYLAILFASVPGISKVGSYTGTASNLTVDCGFSNGVRFLIIKKTSDTGNWYTYKDINAGNDNHVFLDTTSAQVSADYVDSTSSGFTVDASATPLNANGASYIFYAVAL